MPVFNRRNATLGWIALFFGKRILKRKAKAVVRTTARSPRHSAAALLIAVAVGAAAFVRRRAGDEAS
jgi:hypothetical protein